MNTDLGTIVLGIATDCEGLAESINQSNVASATSGETQLNSDDRNFTQQERDIYTALGQVPPS
jgi:hypothetical protein